MTTAITAIGTANPIFTRPHKEVVDHISSIWHLKPVEKRLMKSIYRSTGIEKRHSVLRDYVTKPGEFEFFPNDANLEFPSTAKRMQVYKDNALPLALAAIADCSKTYADFLPDTITHVITISCTGMYAPGLDIEIIRALNLRSTTQRTAINFMGCYGTFNGLKVADAICKADPNAKVLLVSVELCTLHFQKKFDLNNIVSNAIFADGAGAVIVESTIDKQKKALSLEQFHCDLIPQTQQEMAWHIADSGFDIVLSSYVPEIIQAGIQQFLTRMMDSIHENSAIDYYAIHPGGLKILEGCEKALNLTKEDNRFSYDVLRNFGNMSSATILFVLKEIWNSVTPEDNQKNIFSCAFGPGLTLEAMMLKTVIPLETDR